MKVTIKNLITATILTVLFMTAPGAALAHKVSIFAWVEGETIYRSAMEKRGDGVNDIIFGVDDIEKETAALVRKGVRVALSGRYRDGQAFAYFDTCERGGEIMVRLIQDDAA